MKKKYTIIILLSLLAFTTKAQEFNSYYQNIVNQIDFELLDENLQTHEDFGAKEPGSDEILNSFEWLKSNYEDWGYTDIKIDTFMYGGSECYNLVVTKTGVKFPNEYVIIDGHYDTRNGPGSDDNGTGTVIVLECARLLKNVDTDYSIRFIHFSAEEYGLIGSYHYVENTVVPEDHQIKLVFNIDAVGGVLGMDNSTIVCERDESSPSGNNEASARYTDTLSILMEMYSEMNTVISYAYATDYVPFMENGYVITGLYENHENSYAHTPNDLISNLDLESVHEVAKGSVAASLYFSGAHNYLNTEENYLENSVAIFPNPVSDNLHIKFNEIVSQTELKLINQQGQVLISEEIGSQTELNMEHLPTGIYFLMINDADNNQIIKKISKVN